MNVIYGDKNMIFDDPSYYEYQSGPETLELWQNGWHLAENIFDAFSCMQIALFLFYFAENCSHVSN